MAITWTDVENLYAAASTVPAGTQASILAEVALTVFEDTWGERFDIASALLATHYAAEYKAGAGAPAGAVTSKSVGDVSIGYGSPMRMNPASDFDSTPWGRRFMMLARSLPGSLGSAL